jgi:hypothetical protein
MPKARACRVLGISRSANYRRVVDAPRERDLRAPRDRLSQRGDCQTRSLGLLEVLPLDAAQGRNLEPQEGAAGLSCHETQSVAPRQTPAPRTRPPVSLVGCYG